MSSSIADNSPSSLELLASLKSQLREASLKQQLSILPQFIEAGSAGYQILMNYLLEVKDQPAAALAAGRSLQLLHPVSDPEVSAFLNTHFAQGLVPLPATCAVDYTDIQTALMAQAFEQADRLTLQKMCELAGANAVKRKWLYFTEINIFPVVDLQTLDRLWLTYSAGNFGFSKQREIWLGVGKNWEKLWPKIAWKDGNTWARYPGEFIWNLQAPAGHLPLTNQLRGVRVMDALLNHPAWQTERP